MPLSDIDLYEIRQHHGSQADALEELCCQLANDEPLDNRVRFDSKGRGGNGLASSKLQATSVMRKNDQLRLDVPRGGRPRRHHRAV